MQGVAQRVGTAATVEAAIREECEVVVEAKEGREGGQVVREVRVEVLEGGDVGVERRSTAETEVQTGWEGGGREADPRVDTWTVGHVDERAVVVALCSTCYRIGRTRRTSDRRGNRRSTWRYPPLARNQSLALHCPRVPCRR